MMYLSIFYMTMNKKVKKLVTHSGSFHTDDIFAAAAIALMLEQSGEQYEIIRTRDPEIIKTGDYVFDVGGIHDESINRFDHHQIGGAGKNEYGIEYSSFGLVWKKFGAEICGNQKVADIINKKLVAPVDSFDNGMDLVENKHDVTPYFIQHVFLSMCPTWQEENLTNDEMFFECIPIGRRILEREIAHGRDFVLAEESVIKIYNNSPDKRVIILDKLYPYEPVLINFPEPLFVVYPRVDKSWGVKTVKVQLKNFKHRKGLPIAWSGLTGPDLQKVSGVSDAIFCHRALFLAGAKSKEGAIKLAQLALLEPKS